MSPRLLQLVRVSPWLPRAIISAGGCAFAAAAGAQGFSVGVGAGADRGRVDCVATFPCDRSGTHFKLTGAWRFAAAWDAQVVYFDAGHFQGGDTTPLGTEFGGRFKVSGLGLSGGYRLDVAPAWSLTGRVGFASVHTRFDYANPVWGSASKTTLQPLAGLALGYAVTPMLRIGVDYDVTRFKVHTTRGPVQMLGVAAQYSF